ncbi:Zinc finger protein [Sphaceloma murrayae]|uniref:Zinc finger protein n=1 Tax=Sphaceloma murrayae TaxID=2082308 RepID=A0A2K1QWH6_9PEZI|nr:Zinc finger protein [Sphaceloma murrayae]
MDPNFHIVPPPPPMDTSIQVRPTMGPPTRHPLRIASLSPVPAQETKTNDTKKTKDKIKSELRGFEIRKERKTFDIARRREGPLSQANLAEEMRKSVDENGENTAMRTYRALSDNKRSQIDALLHRMRSEETQKGAEWSLVHLDPVRDKVKGSKEAKVAYLLVIVQRHGKEKDKGGKKAGKADKSDPRGELININEPQANSKHKKKEKIKDEIGSTEHLSAVNADDQIIYVDPSAPPTPTTALPVSYPQYPHEAHPDAHCGELVPAPKPFPYHYFPNARGPVPPQPYLGPPRAHTPPIARFPAHGARRSDDSASTDSTDFGGPVWSVPGSDETEWLPPSGRFGPGRGEERGSTRVGGREDVKRQREERRLEDERRAWERELRIQEARIREEERHRQEERQRQQERRRQEERFREEERLKEEERRREEERVREQAELREVERLRDEERLEREERRREEERRKEHERSRNAERRQQDRIQEDKRRQQEGRQRYDVSPRRSARDLPRRGSGRLVDDGARRRPSPRGNERHYWGDTGCRSEPSSADGSRDSDERRTYARTGIGGLVEATLLMEQQKDIDAQLREAVVAGYRAGRRIAERR